mmetsp:Transcript_16858/g.26794  ORF Transcript_16858/g.26794 Transcript_16858/m.26794 type:complete len:189 (+) Transcript_16858:67-633(+)
MMRVLVLLALAVASAADVVASHAKGKLVRMEITAAANENKHVTKEPLVAAAINHHAPMSDQSTALAETESDDPCRSLGCNSRKCEWVTGEVVRKVVTKKACKNAKALKPRSNTIETLTQCLRAVKGKVMAQDNADDNTEAAVLVDGPEQCSTFFEMHMETNQCSCVPADAHCDEQSDEKICRFELVSY